MNRLPATLTRDLSPFTSIISWGDEMRRLLIPVLLCVLLAAGCNGGPAPVESGNETQRVTVLRPTYVINTTKGPIKVALFPTYREYEGKFYIDGTETQYLAFVEGAHSGYYNGAPAIPVRKVVADYVWFFSRSRSGDYAVPYLPKSNIQPVRGTLCVMRLDSANRPGIYADKRSFMIVRNIATEIGGREQFPLKGIHFPIGQVVEGWKVLDKLGKDDSIVSMEKGADTTVSAEKLKMLSEGKIDDFAKVLEK